MSLKVFHLFSDQSHRSLNKKQKLFGRFSVKFDAKTFLKTSKIYAIKVFSHETFKPHTNKHHLIELRLKK